MADDWELQDPDEYKQDASFGWDEEFQRSIIALLMTDRTFLLQSVDLIKPNYFTQKAHKVCCEIIFKHFEQHKVVPARVIVTQEAKDKFKDDKSALFYLSEIESIYDYFEPSIESRQYFTDKIMYFAKIQAIRQAFNQSLKQVDKAPESEETWSKVYDLLREAMNIDKNFDIGLEYFKNIPDRYERMKEDDVSDLEKFITGHESIDSSIKGGGYRRGEMISIVAGSGVGKSVWLTCMAAVNVLRGKKCLYISLELTEDRIAERFDAILTGAPIQCLYDSKESVFQKLENIVHTKEDKNMIVIKQFPSASADVNTIRAYLSQVRFYGFEPDMIIVDYIGEMKDYAGIPTHESRERIVKELRGIAGEENIFMATAMQPNRGSKEAQKSPGGRIEEEHLADSFGQIRPLDGCFSLNQNDNEKAVNMGRFYVIKQRFGKSRIEIPLRFCPKTLKIYEIDRSTYKDVLTSKNDNILKDVSDVISGKTSSFDIAKQEADSYKPTEEEEL